MMASAQEKTVVRGLLVAMLLAVAIVQLLGMALADPSYPETLTTLSITRKTLQGAGSGQVVAYAGNVSEIDITQDQITKNWQGYYGEVTGRIILDDVVNMSLYRWDLVNPRGEVYATRNSTSINWTGGNIVCAVNINDSVTNESNPIYREELEMRTNSEVVFPTTQARDGVNETFNVSASHPAFNVSNNAFSANTCNHTTSLYVNDTAPNGAPVPRSFNETLIWSRSDRSLIFMAYINPNQYGFNNSADSSSRYDFEMLVTEDGHLDDKLQTTYYFYVELE